MATVYTFNTMNTIHSTMNTFCENNQDGYYDDGDYVDGEEYDGDGSCHSEYECDISLRSLHSYSSYETTLSDLELCTAKDKKFRRMTTLDQDFQMIERLLVQRKDDALRGEDVVSDNDSVSSFEPVLTKTVPAVAPWVAIQKTQVVSMTSIIQDEATIKKQPVSTATNNHRTRNTRDDGAYNGKVGANGRRQQYQGRYNNADGSKTSHHHKQPENPGTLNGRNPRNNNTNTKSPPPRKSLLLSKNDNISSARSDTISVRSDPNASDNSRICKFGSKCAHKSRCGRAHSYNEWEPRMCRFATSCKSMTSCRYIHAKETKEVYLRRMVDTVDTFYHKNKEMYIKSFRLV